MTMNALLSSTRFWSFRHFSTSVDFFSFPENHQKALVFFGDAENSCSEEDFSAKALSIRASNHNSALEHKHYLLRLVTTHDLWSIWTPYGPCGCPCQPFRAFFIS